MRIGQVEEEAGKEEEKSREEEILREEERRDRAQKKSNRNGSLKTRDKKVRKKSDGQHSLAEGINERELIPSNFLCGFCRKEAGGHMIFPCQFMRLLIE